MPNVAINEYVTPSEKTINFIYKGLLAFFPETAAPIFDLPKGTYGSMESWQGFDRSEFLEFVFDITAQYRLTTDLEEAVEIIRDWKEGGYPERTVPVELNELVAGLEEDIETKASPYAIREKVKAAQLLARKVGETRPEGFKLPKGPSVVIPSPPRKPLLKESPPFFIEPIETPPPPAEMARITKLLQESAQTPEGFQSEKEDLNAKVLQEARKNLPRVFNMAPPDQLEKVVGAIVEETMRRLVEGPSAAQIPDPQALTPLANPENLMSLVPDPSLRQMVADTAAKLQKLTKDRAILAKALIEPVLGPEIAENLFPSSETKYRVTPTPTNKTVLVINPTDFVENPPTPPLLAGLPSREHLPESAIEIGPVEAKPAAPSLKETTLPPEPVKELGVKEPILEEVSEQEPVAAPSTTVPTVSIPIPTIPVPTISSPSEQVVPSEKAVGFLYNGLLATYPETATSAFDLPKGSYQPSASWAGLGRKELSEFVCKVTRSSNLSEAAIVIREWHEGKASDKKIPANIDALVVKLDDMNAEKVSASELEAYAGKVITLSQRWEPVPPTSEAVTEKPEVPIYLEPSKPIPTPVFTEKELIVLQAGVALQNPEQFVVDLTKTIIDRVNETAPEYAKTMTPGELKAFSEALATRTAQVIRSEYKSLEPSHWALAALANSNDPILVNLFPDSKVRLKFVEAIQGRALALEATDTLERDFLYRVFGKEIGEKLLGPEGPIEWTLSETKTENSEFEFQPGKFLKAHKAYLEKLKELREAVASGDQDFIQKSTYRALSTFRSGVSWAGDTKGVLPVGLFKTSATGVGAVGYTTTMSLAALWGSRGIPIVPLTGGGFINVITTSTGTRMLVTPLIKLVDLSFGSAGFVQIGFGHIGIGTVAPELAGRAVQGVLGQAGKPAVAISAKIGGTAISAVSTKLGAVLAQIGALLGVSAPVVGQAIAAVIGAIAGKIIEKVVAVAQKHKTETAAVLLSPLILVAIIFQIPALFIVYGLGVGIALAGGAQALIVKGASSIASLIGAVTAFAAGSVASSLIISVISLPIIIAFVFFIITVGAYVVPNSKSLEPGLAISPYIGVTKTANPAGPFDNKDLPKPIEYTITIVAKKETLTNIQFEDKCEVVAKGKKVTCPDTDTGYGIPKPGDPNYPKEISPAGGGKTFKYRRTYKSPDFTDTLVINTFTVTADAPEKQGAQSSASVSVKFGKPPEDCPSGWPIGPENGESHLTITEGPLGGSHSYTKMEAIDIGANIGHTITARHSGIVKVYENDPGNYGPKYIEITSTCNGKQFVSLYAHLSAVKVQTGQSVTLGQVVGYSGTGGTGGHLHYEFRGLLMAPVCTPEATNCIPKAVPYKCTADCGTIP